MPFSGQNSPFAPNENFFRKTINTSCMYLLVPFTVQNFKKKKKKKNYLEQIESYEYATFLSLIFALHEKFLKIIFLCFLAPFIEQNVKKMFRVDLKLREHVIFRTKIICLPPKITFSGSPLVNLVTFIHVYLRAKIQRQISIH